jgi:hypothetical protein
MRALNATAMVIVTMTLSACSKPQRNVEGSFAILLVQTQTTSLLSTGDAGPTGDARIGSVTFSKTGRTHYYRGQTFQSLKGAGFKSNYYCVETGEDYWNSGPKRRGGDALYGGSTPIEIDEDVREEYWRDIRRQSERIHDTVA